MFKEAMKHSKEKNIALTSLLGMILVMYDWAHKKVTPTLWLIDSGKDTVWHLLCYIYQSAHR